jgi:hypothetical protein
MLAPPLNHAGQPITNHASRPVIHCLCLSRSLRASVIWVGHGHSLSNGVANESQTYILDPESETYGVKLAVDTNLLVPEQFDMRLTFQLFALRLLSSLFMPSVLNNLAGTLFAGLNSSKFFVINLFSGTVPGWTAIVLDLMQRPTPRDAREQPIIVLLDDSRKKRRIKLFS